ncbi:hypothetical protein HPB47_017315 [Ixodes persulcatus]|uniref:Uncharacterized protein n=1 Tax=Ixodes persulcatus TaxID=34615 RepID=A0AC60QNL8_IXOPE|nr:hypothetical protein HPB47_017315 [Ixodes persulcatus]
MVVRIVSTVSFMDNRESILGCRSCILSTVSFQERRRSSFSFTSDNCAMNAEGSARDDFITSKDNLEVYKIYDVDFKCKNAKALLNSVCPRPCDWKLTREI